MSFFGQGFGSKTLLHISGCTKTMLVLIITISMVTLGIDLLRRENSCSSFCAACVGWKLVGLLPDLSRDIVGDDEVI